MEYFPNSFQLILICLLKGHRGAAREAQLKEREKQTKTAWNVIQLILYLSLSKCLQSQQGKISAGGRLHFGWNQLNVKSDDRIWLKHENVSKVFSDHVLSNTLFNASFKLPMKLSLFICPKHHSIRYMQLLCTVAKSKGVLVVLLTKVETEIGAFLNDLHGCQRAVEK